MSARERRRKSKPLKRLSETKPVRRTFRVYTEGKATEPEYIDAIKRLPEFAANVAVDLVIEQAGRDPATLVLKAVADKRKESLDIDFYWCVFDVESPTPHPNLDATCNMARSNGINLAISNPCFELWLVLHLQDQTAYLTTAEATKLWTKLSGSESKRLDAARYVPKRDAANQRAKSLREKHERDCTGFPEDNPSSTFDQLLDAIESLLPTANMSK